MKLEKHKSEKNRLMIFKSLYGILFFILLSFLVQRQVFEAEDYHEKERKQGQRRIIRPGSRGDVLDREGRLLIGNEAHFTAVLHLENLKKEIWEKKKVLRNLAFDLRKEFNLYPLLSLNQLINRCFHEEFIANREITLSGYALQKNQARSRPRVFIDGQRQDVKEEKDGFWSCQLTLPKQEAIHLINFENTTNEVEANAAGLFRVTFLLDDSGLPLPFQNAKPANGNWLKFLLPTEGTGAEFNTSGFSLEWEARLAVVANYQQKVNRLLQRNDEISMSELKKHWLRRLVMPLELSTNLLPHEYAVLVEGLSADSPIQIQAEAIRHYPHGSLASHVLGYVGSGYESNPRGLSGEDLATFEIKGRTGKSGIERKFDSKLRGKDGGDIWRVNPMGSRFERIERKRSEKGQTIQTSIDLDIQKIAESSLERISRKVVSYRVLPDLDWKNTIQKRTRKELITTNERELSPELLLSAFQDAPFPLGPSEASTVAGFRGTPKDAESLLRLLYSKGVLEVQDTIPRKYVIAPPPNPPGAAVLLDLESGEILALASMPNYNLEKFSPRITQSEYDKIERMGAWLPRAWHPGYCPASPFKLVTAVAALRAKVVSPEETIVCDGIYKGMICHCYPGKHGEMNLISAEAQSCNVYFFQLAERLGQDPLILEAKSFGMAQTPNIELPKLRNSPNVPDPEWKRKKVGEKWALEDTFNVAIGQGGLRQSPLQMACFAAALAKRQKIFEPTLIKTKRIIPPSEPIGLADDDYDALIAGMHQATISGTAKRCQIPGIPIAGKTGTAQWRNHNMKLSLAWFIGFAPVKKPEVAIAVLIEGVIPQDHIQGGLTATPVAKEILEAYFEKKAIKLAKFN